MIVDALVEVGPGAALDDLGDSPQDEVRERKGAGDRPDRDAGADGGSAGPGAQETGRGGRTRGPAAESRTADPRRRPLCSEERPAATASLYPQDSAKSHKKRTWTRRSRPGRPPPAPHRRPPTPPRRPRSPTGPTRDACGQPIEENWRRIEGTLRPARPVHPGAAYGQRRDVCFLAESGRGRAYVPTSVPSQWTCGDAAIGVYRVCN